MIEIYGIPNCDTIKKARKWLDAKGLEYTFHDYKKESVDLALVHTWIDAAGWEKVLNRAGTTFRKLPEAEKADLDADKAAAIMIAQPSCIKRPIAAFDGGVLIGFNAAEWDQALVG